jgi:starch synthase
LTAAYLAYDGRPRPATVITLHNLAFQGQYPAALLAPLGLPPRAFALDGVEYYGMIPEGGAVSLRQGHQTE